VQLVGIGRLRYRPHTRLTAAWWADLQTNSEPHIKEAVMKAMNQLASLLKDGYIPPSAVDWNDSGDNNAFHAKLCILDFGGTISIELAVIHNKEEYDDILTHGMPNDDQGKPVPAQIEAYGCVIPKGAKHPEVAREFLEYAIRPKVLSEYLKGSLGRWAIPMAKFAANDPFWGHNSDPHLKAYFQETLFGPTTPSFEAFNPAVGQIDAEHVFQVGIADIASHGVAPEAATDKALKRIGEIFKKYPIKAT
ncbi:MAG: hypothetical protein ACREDL_20850, partial [Bradyrhizobium sp.]